MIVVPSKTLGFSVEQSLKLLNEAGFKLELEKFTDCQHAYLHNYREKCSLFLGGYPLTTTFEEIAQEWAVECLFRSGLNLEIRLVDHSEGE